jgi:4-hydroxy-4-methyl-2-oxoglutarate aldolase
MARRGLPTGYAIEKGGSMVDEMDDAELERVCEEKLYTGAICDMLDEMGYRHQYLGSELMPLREGDVLCGRAYTTILDDIYEPVDPPMGKFNEALDHCPEGAVYVVAGGARRCGYFGGIMTATIKARGGKGAIVEGYMRDTREVLEQDFKVWSMGKNAQGSGARNEVVAYDVPVEINGVRIEPGELLFADVDGAVAIPPQIEQELIGRVLEKVDAERETRAAIIGGMSATEAVKRFGNF